MRVKSSIDSFTPAACAIASRCSTALVDPPSAMTVVIAFSNALRVRMSRGRMLLLDQVAPPPRRPARSRRASRPRSRPAPSCSAGSGRAPRSPTPSCWRCTCRRTSRRPGHACCSRSASAASRQLAGGVLPDRFEHRHDVDRLALEHAGQDGAAVDEHRGTIEPRHRHHAARHVLVAAADRHQAVEALRRPSRSRSSRRSPRATPANTSCPSVPIEMASDTVMVLKITGLAPALRHAVGGVTREHVDVHVARRHLAPRRADADLGLREVLAREADGVQHGAPGRAFGAVEDQ